MFPPDVRFDVPKICKLPTVAGAVAAVSIIEPVAFAIKEPRTKKILTLLPILMEAFELLTVAFG